MAPDIPAMSVKRNRSTAGWSDLRVDRDTALTKAVDTKDR